MTDSAPSYRLFIALSVAEEVKEHLRQAQSELRAGLRQDAVRWTPPGQIHVTLKYLGNVAAGRVDELMESLRAQCMSVAPLQLRAESIGFFPNARRPRIIWSALKSERGELDQLQRRVETCAAIFTPAMKEEAFAGHLTIGRVKRINSPDARALEEAAAAMAGSTFGSWMAASVEIMRSELSAAGSRYSRVGDIPLKC